MTATVTRPQQSPRATKHSSRGRSRRREAIALVIPSLVPILVFSVVPLLNGIYLAFTNATLRRNSDNAFIGLENFGRLAGDSLFWSSFKIGMIWAVSVTVLQLVAGMGLALLLNSDLRFKSLTRVLALIPWAMPPVVVAIMWTMIYSPRSGPLNATLGFFGRPSEINWLGDFSTALPAVIVVGVWVGMPQTTVILLAGLQQIAPELYEAASVDGANAWVRFWRISLPSLRPIIASITSLNLIWNFNSVKINLADALIPPSKKAQDQILKQTGGKNGWAETLSSAKGLTSAPFLSVDTYTQWKDTIATPAYQKYLANKIDEAGMKKELTDGWASVNR